MDGGPNKFRILAVTIVGAFAVAAMFVQPPLSRQDVSAQTSSTPAPFDQAAAIAKLREQIKGKENEPAEKVFKNIQTPMLKGGPASRVLAVMEFGFSRSLGVTCTHCHAPDKWESEEKPQKQVAREMAAMVARINGELLKSIKNLKSGSPTVNCTTCHRGEVKPALNIQPRS